MAEEIPTPYELHIELPEDVVSSQEKLNKEVSQQSLLMSVLHYSHLSKLRNQLELPQDKGQLPQVFHIGLPDSVGDWYDKPDDESSGAAAILEDINEKLIAAPGSLTIPSTGTGKVQKSPVKFFNNLHTSTLSSMLHRAELFLILRSADGEIISQHPFNFSTKNRGKDIEAMLDNKYERGFGVSIEDISITCDAQDPALSKFVVCDLRIKMASGRYLQDFINNSYTSPEGNPRDIVIEDLFYTKKHSTYSDETGQGYKAEIALKLGYTPPTLDSYKNKRVVDSKIHTMTQTFFLVPVTYDIAVEPNGELMFSIKYNSSFDAEMDSRSRKKVDKKTKVSPKSKIALNSLERAAIKYQQETKKDISKVREFIDYTRRLRAVAAENSKYERCKDMIDSITEFGKKTFVLPYYIDNMREIEEEKVVKEEQTADDAEAEKITTYKLNYVFDKPILRSSYARSTSEDIRILNRAESVHVIEFVLFGEIIDYVFSEFLSNKDRPVPYQAALFSAFSFGLYDPYSLREVDRVMNMRDIPISLDLLWDLLYDSKITDSGSGQIIKANYYSDLISKAYSTVYRSCDKSINYLSADTSAAHSAPSVRKVGTPEINAVEVYVPKSVFTEILEPTKQRMVDNRTLTSLEVDGIMNYIAMKESKGSQVSDAPSKKDFCRIMFFTSHMPYVASSSRQPDFEFTAFGQYGIVKSLSYSPVPVDGLLESAIAARSKNQDSKVDSESSDKFYHTMLKVDITTFGYPVVAPGMTVEVDKTLLAVNEGSTIKNSLTNSFYVTRVTTNMNKSDYTTTIEGYPRFPKPPPSDNPQPSEKFSKTEKDNLIKELSSYKNYVLSGISIPQERDWVKESTAHIQHWLFQGTTPMRKFFPKLLPQDSTLKVYDRWGFNDDYNGPKVDPQAWALLERDSDGVYVVKPYMLGSPSLMYRSSKDPYTISIEMMKKVKEKTESTAAILAQELGVSPLSSDIEYGNYFNEILEKIYENGRFENYSPPISVYYHAIEMIYSAIEAWRSNIKELATAAGRSDTQNTFNHVLKSNKYFSEDGYVELAKFLTDLNNHLNSLSAEKTNSDLENLIQEIMDNATE